MSVKVNFVGRLGTDAETVTTQTASFISLRVAVNERVNREDVTTWMTVTCDYERYKNLAKFLTKGSVIQVNGSERCSIYKSKAGQYGIDRKVSADSIEFVNLGKKEKVDTITPENTEAAVAVAAKANVEMTTGGLRGVIQPVPNSSSDNSGFDGVPTADDDLPF